MDIRLKAKSTHGQALIDRSGDKWTVRQEQAQGRKLVCVPQGTKANALCVPQGTKANALCVPMRVVMRDNDLDFEWHPCGRLEPSPLELGSTNHWRKKYTPDFGNTIDLQSHDTIDLQLHKT